MIRKIRVEPVSPRRPLDLLRPPLSPLASGGGSCTVTSARTFGDPLGSGRSTAGARRWRTPTKYGNAHICAHAAAVYRKAEAMADLQLLSVSVRRCLKLLWVCGWPILTAHNCYRSPLKLFQPLKTSPFWCSSGCWIKETLLQRWRTLTPPPSMLSVSRSEWRGFQMRFFWFVSCSWTVLWQSHPRSPARAQWVR